MAAASVWSLIMPAIEMCGSLGKLCFIPALVGLLCGAGFMILSDHIPGVDSKLFLAVTIHNFPEGAACGAILAGALSDESQVTMAAAVMLAVGIAIQNFPEGAIISFPLRADGKSAREAFGMGVLSGAVEPVSAVITLLLARFIEPILPYLLAFAAGTMICVVVEELIPEAMATDKKKGTALAFIMGFALMMVLDITLG